MLDIRLCDKVNTNKANNENDKANNKIKSKLKNMIKLKFITDEFKLKNKK